VVESEEDNDSVIESVKAKSEVDVDVAEDVAVAAAAVVRVDKVAETVEEQEEEKEKEEVLQVDATKSANDMESAPGLQHMQVPSVEVVALPSNSDTEEDHGREVTSEAKNGAEE
jgi:hypothetical protein